VGCGEEGEGPLKFFDVVTDDLGITTITFDRPPVNAVSYDVYRDVRELSERLIEDDTTRVAILTADPNGRAWCGGAELKEFLPLDQDSRLQRYSLVNDCLPRLLNVDRPIIAAMEKPAIGVGMVLASFCDIRIASESAFFAAPEVDRGVLPGGGGFFTRLNMPLGIVREMIFTGRRFTAQEMLAAGYLNYVMPNGTVMDKARELAEILAKKSLPAQKENKRSAIAAEDMNWRDAYKATNAASARLTATLDAKENVRAVLEKREPQLFDQ
jgi:enoyl-CoA hydratase/carnithine racemase